MRAQDPAQDPIVVRLRDQSVEETLATYIDLVAGSPDKADVAALALREQGRLGRLKESHLDMLIKCVELAPNLLCLGHLAKALAAMGRKAMKASDALVQKLGPMVIADDVEYWSFDGAVWALGYLGGAKVSSFLDTLAKEPQLRSVRSPVYRGVMPRPARQKQFASAIAGARGLAEKSDPGLWRTRMITTPLTRPAQAKSTGRAWDVRAAVA
ncbi:MAG: hypothetical protein HY791_20600 [Deltaproteobacteria bacterium]|nr:hypothetical protein [Deltaproteobacteria bacterium]